MVMSGERWHSDNADLASGGLLALIVISCATGILYGAAYGWLVFGGALLGVGALVLARTGWSAIRTPRQALVPDFLSMNLSLKIIPCSLRDANDFVSAYHRHNGRTARDGGRFAIAIESGNVVGVAVVGNPLSATYMDGFTAEVLRVCVRPDAPTNCNSMLYGACRRVWFAMGGTRLITYTLLHESGVSLRASGWQCEAEINGHDPKSWGKNPDKARRTEAHVIALRKLRWVCLRHDWEPKAIRSRPSESAEFPLLSNIAEGMVRNEVR
jgi:hypothetical protein